MRSRTTALLCAALVVVGGAVVWFVMSGDVPSNMHPLPPPAKRAAVPAPKNTPPAAASTTTPAAPKPPEPPPRDRRAIDPEIQKLADRLTDHSQTPLNDLEVVNEFFEMYRKTFSQLPVGSNEDLTAILTGSNPQEGMLFPADSPMIVRGQIVDRWGSPYWLHPNSGARVEIRSAGPDKSLFTSDDVVINASPGGLGATPDKTL